MIRLGSYLRREGGWSRHARSFALALQRYEPLDLIDWEFWPSPAAQAWNQRLRERLSRKSVGISLGALDRTPALRTRYRIAYSTIEATRIPMVQLFYLHQADAVWTPSHWGRGVLVDNGIPAAKVHVVPGGVDSSVFSPPSNERCPGPVFRFLCIGKWEERKANALLVQAFAEEFAPAEPVELVMHCGSTLDRAIDFRAELARAVARSGRADARVVASDPIDLEKLIDLMRRCHAFVLPTRGEAWGLPILEAMACGLPSIVTDYSGPREYANPDNCYLVRVAALVGVEDPEFYDPSQDWGIWAEPDRAHLRHLMRFVYENPDDAARKGRRAREDAARYWTWEAAAQKAMAHIRELRRG